MPRMAGRARSAVLPEAVGRARSAVLPGVAGKPRTAGPVDPACPVALPLPVDGPRQVRLARPADKAGSAGRASVERPGLVRRSFRVDGVRPVGPGAAALGRRAVPAGRMDLEWAGCPVGPVGPVGLGR
ncbi:Uncharacterised protein [Mycobacterium tuberculosis]|nr:Uncharacterised protein [Mycobacterium tuberculosis]